MSEEIFQRQGLYVTRFYGGTERGPCIQFTMSRSGVILDAFDLKVLAMKLDSWLRFWKPSAPENPSDDTGKLSVGYVEDTVNGPCVELVCDGGRAYVQLDGREVKALAAKLELWLDTTGQPAIDKVIAAEKTRVSSGGKS